MEKWLEDSESVHTPTALGDLRWGEVEAVLSDTSFPFFGQHEAVKGSEEDVGVFYQNKGLVIRPVAAEESNRVPRSTLPF